MANPTLIEKAIERIGNKLFYLRNREVEERRYARWVEANSIGPAERERLRLESSRLARRPLISVLVPVYDVDERWLRACLDSVTSQIYDNWQLCVADDCSPSAHVRRVLEEYAARDPRVRVVFRPQNGHIAAASNSALELADGEFVALLDHDDELAADALLCVAREILEHPEAGMIYSDEDMIDEDGRRFGPHFKPDFSPELFLSYNFPTHLCAYRRSVVIEAGGFRAGTEGSQDYDLALRVTERLGPRGIRHIPRILYHWRAIRGSVALSAGEKPYAYERARTALREHLERTGRGGSVSKGFHDYHRVAFALPGEPPRVSVIVAPGQGNHLPSTTDYANLEIVETGVMRRGDAPAALLNDAAAKATGEIICFVEAGLEPDGAGWLAELVGQLLQPDIGAVAGKVVNRYGKVVRTGLVAGVGGLVAHAHEGMPEQLPGYLARASVVGNFSALPWSCLAIRKSVFDEAGGFDSATFPRALFDADLCLRIGAAGRRCVFTPFAVMRGNVTSTKPTVPEANSFKERWRAVVARDPFYNPNLTLSGTPFSIGASD